MLIHSDPNIVITISQNGFIVSLPPLPEPGYDEMQAVRIIKAANKAAMSDPLLEKLSGEVEQTKPSKARLKDVKSERLFVFATFDDVLKFLEKEMR